MFHGHSGIFSFCQPLEEDDDYYENVEKLKISHLRNGVPLNRCYTLTNSEILSLRVIRGPEAPTSPTLTTSSSVSSSQVPPTSSSESSGSNKPKNVLPPKSKGKSSSAAKQKYFQIMRPEDMDGLDTRTDTGHAYQGELTTVDPNSHSITMANVLRSDLPPIFSHTPSLQYQLTSSTSNSRPKCRWNFAAFSDLKIVHAQRKGGTCITCGKLFHPKDMKIVRNGNNHVGCFLEKRIRMSGAVCEIRGFSNLGEEDKKILIEYFDDQEPPVTNPNAAGPALPEHLAVGYMPETQVQCAEIAWVRAKNPDGPGHYFYNIFDQSTRWDAPTQFYTEQQYEQKCREFEEQRKKNCYGTDEVRAVRVGKKDVESFVNVAAALPQNAPQPVVERNWNWNQVETGYGESDQWRFDCEGGGSAKPLIPLLSHGSTFRFPSKRVYQEIEEHDGQSLHFDRSILDTSMTTTSNGNDEQSALNSSSISFPTTVSVPSTVVRYEYGGPHFEATVPPSFVSAANGERPWGAGYDWNHEEIDYRNKVSELHDADEVPSENVLYVCQLNPVTTDKTLENNFSPFGKINNCEIGFDHENGDSYAFIEFDNETSCEKAFVEMDNVRIDGRRIHVFFSQYAQKKYNPNRDGRRDRDRREQAENHRSPDNHRDHHDDRQDDRRRHDRSSDRRKDHRR